MSQGFRLDTATRLINEWQAVAFQKLLSLYYRKRGWDEDGIPPAGAESKFDD